MNGRAPDGTIPLLSSGLYESYIRCRLPPKLAGKYWSFVNVGVCNFACAYCIKGGYEKDSRNRLPHTLDVDEGRVMDFIDDQCRKGNPIKISGAEPLVLVDITRSLLARIRKKGGFSSISTNGSLPGSLEKLVSLVDLVSIDLKAPPPRGAKVTGVKSRELYWDNPCESILLAAAGPCEVEVASMFFRFTTLRDLLQMYERIPEKTPWQIKQFFPERTQPDGTSRRDTSRLPAWLKPPAHATLRRTLSELCRAKPDLRGRFFAVARTRDNTRIVFRLTEKGALREIERTSVLYFGDLLGKNAP